MEKILYVITKASWGGAQRYVYDMSAAAKARGYDVAVAYGGDGELAERLTKAGVRGLSLAALSRDVRGAGEWTAFTSLFSLVRRERPGVLHLNSSKAGVLGGLAGRLAGTPRIVFTAHGWAWNEERPVWQKAFIALSYYVAVLCAHTVVCVSQELKREASWMPFVQKKLVVVHNGISRPAFLERAAAREHLLPDTHERYWVGMVAELHPTKRVRDAVDALRHLPANVALVVAGEGQARSALEEHIESLGLQNRAFLLGHVRDAARYLNAFDVFVMSSQSEALGYALLEAGMAALPAVATDVGGLPEIIENGRTGLLVPPRAPEKIAEAIRFYLDHQSTAAQMGNALKAKVERDFSAEQMVRETLALYRR